MRSRSRVAVLVVAVAALAGAAAWLGWRETPVPAQAQAQDGEARAASGRRGGRQRAEGAPSDVVAPPAACEVVAGADGFVGTWRLLAGGATLPSTVEPVAIPPGPVAPEDVGRSVIVSDRATIDLQEALGDPARVAVLGLRLHAGRDARVQLMLGAAGALSVWLDGREVGTLTAPELRSDDVLVRLELTRGSHDLVVRATRGEPRDPLHPPRWAMRARFLDARATPGTGGVRLDLGEVPEASRAALRDLAVRVEETRAIDAEGLGIHVRVSLPAGGIAGDVPVRLPAAPAAQPAPATAAAAAAPAPDMLRPRHGAFRSGLTRTYRAPARGDLGLELGLPTRTVALGERLALDRPVATAALALRPHLTTAPESARAPVAWRIAELERIVAERDPDTRWRRTMSDDARRLARTLAGGRNPFADPHGYVRMAFLSSIDATPQPYELFVPLGYRARNSTRAWPLVVTLHGFKGNAGDYFRNTFGLARGEESLDAHGRHGPPPTEGPMFVIAPTGRGQAMYRQAGEEDVLEAIADVRARFRIDDARIYVTGGSMGGTGAAYLPYRHPHLFAASAALAGYHDQRVREDTDHAALSGWERFLQAERSDVDWAWNGNHLPMLLVRGTRDRPLAWTRRLVERLGELGYRHEHREPELGHNVWTETYAAGAIFGWFSPHRRPAAPAHVRLRTARERHARAWWVEVNERSAPDVFAEVEARVAADGAITATTRNTLAITIHPRTASTDAAPAELVVRIDDDTLTGPAPLRARRDASGHWHRVSAHDLAGHKRPGVSGPIRDAYHEPLLFVVGTQDPAHTWINRIVARTFARPPGWDVAYPIVEDTAVTEAMTHDHLVVLVGPPRSNALHARWHQQLPFRYGGDTIAVGRRRHTGEQVGAIYIAPSPDTPTRAVVVIAGPTPLGTWRSLFLPDLLPDYAIFDERIAPARDRWAAGGTGATFRETGFFDMDWSLPR